MTRMTGFVVQGHMSPFVLEKRKKYSSTSEQNKHDYMTEFWVNYHFNNIVIL